MRTIVVAVGISAFLVGAGSAAGRQTAAPKTFKLTAVLTAAEEVPPPTGVPAGARGTFSATVDLVKGKITWRLTWSKLSGPNFGAHIHLGKRGVARPSPFLDLCGTQLSASGRACRSGQRRTFDENTPVYPSDLAKLHSRPAYVNVHTGKNPSGEIRGQLKVVR